jgi:hypothetical protein
MILRDEGGKFVAHVEASLFKMEHSVAKISAACASAILRLSPDWRLYRSAFADFGGDHSDLLPQKYCNASYDVRAGLPTVGVSVAKPIFCVVLRNDEQCVVEAEWPDGTIEKIEAFKHKYEAADWIASQSEDWLQERVLID